MFGLRKTLGSLFGLHQIDETWFGHLEETLLKADVGIATTDTLISSLRKTAKTQSINNAEQLKGILVQEITQLLSPLESPQNPLLTPQSGQKPEVWLIVGVNGAGKTTSFYMIVGLVPLDGGSILLDGQKISGLPIHQRARMGLSYLPQEASVFRKLNVAENIQAVLELQEFEGRPLSKKRIRERLDELLGELQITHLRNNPALSLSGGERRRVEIARALASHPKFILLDEPFAGVDPIAVGEIQRIVRFLRDRQIGVLITDHNVRETLGICDHAYIISEGSVLAEGKADEIIQNDEVRRVYLGENFRM